MTTQLQQSLKLLQMPAQELAVYIEQQLVENPFLELQEGQDVDENMADPLPLNNEQDNEPDSFESMESKEAQDDVFDRSTEDYRQSGSQPDSSYDPVSWMEQTLSEEESLHEHLSKQIHMSFSNPAERGIAFALMDRLDENGYLPEKISQTLAEKLNCQPNDIEKIIQKLQQECDPTGIFCRSLQECLAIQLQEKNLLTKEMQKILEHLDYVASANFPALIKYCGITEAELKNAISEIRLLKPKPANSFIQNDVSAIQADVTLTPDGKGHWHIELNDKNLPKVLVNRQYYASTRKGTKDSAEKTYLSDKLSHANWLTKTLNQRAETLLKVSKALVEAQNAFFQEGIYSLKPMTMGVIAEKVAVHESTIARVVNGKYMETPRGIFELRYFFSSGVGGEEGEMESSSHVVKEAIKHLIQKETIQNILSDDALVGILKEQGFAVARRTVAKYRDALNIPSSSVRRKQLKLQSTL